MTSFFVHPQYFTLWNKPTPQPSHHFLHIHHCCSLFIHPDSQGCILISSMEASLEVKRKRGFSNPIPPLFEYTTRPAFNSVLFHKTVTHLNIVIIYVCIFLGISITATSRQSFILQPAPVYWEDSTPGWKVISPGGKKQCVNSVAIRQWHAKKQCIQLKYKLWPFSYI